ncbi:ribonuclease H-like domain-containing protein [Anaerococcus sp. AGMB09787]|uniref:ribonuclease H-like domain-containing protein n=1 Tax=Anaerococcus sp. AGMB09787 TaxID=2922869 RepID=UPI001FB015E2|nr:ribonuclease H-like domain-containing protein [Anaerococcus sp. AGMB09787]
MICIKKIIACKNIKENQIVLDIETTGLDSSVDTLVVLGLVFREDKKAYTIQYFAEDDSEEERLLRIYLEKSAEKEIITYNGDTFDIPFLNNRLIAHKLLPIFPPTIDLLKVIKKYRIFFDFDSLKLSDMEKLVGFYRVDPSRYKTISKLSDDLGKRDKPFPIIKHNQNDIIATELLMDIEKSFIKELTIGTRLGQVSLKSVYINNDIANIKLESSEEQEEAFFVNDNYDISIKNKNITINLQVLYGLLDGKTRGHIAINTFAIENQTDLRIDPHFLVIRQGHIYKYKNILSLSKKIIENHL